MQVRGWKQNKNKRAESDRSCFVMAKTYNFHSSIWASIHCELKIEKQDLQNQESRWQNSSSTTN